MSGPPELDNRSISAPFNLKLPKIVSRKKQQGPNFSFRALKP
jgi:hypothetical protein